MMNGIVRILNLCAMAAVAAAPAWAQNDDHGRISYSTDEALVLGASDDEWSFAGINTLILEGDRVWADDSGAIELEFPGGYYIRLADGAEAEVVSMPPNGLIRGWVGSFYVQRLNSSRGDLTFDTGAAQFTLQPDTVARFDVLTDGATTLSVTRGRVGVFTDDGRVMDISQGNRTYIDPGLLPSSPERFSSAQDTFDVWNGTRVSYLADAVQPEPIRRSQSAAPIGTRDLNSYGDWVYVDNTYYWRPVYVNNYVPYRHGYWSYVPRHGYTWVGYYPFDYVTTHYGYWHHHRRYGWLWSYHPVYAPARVVSIYYGDVLFWAPANRYGYPVYGTHFDFTIGGFNFSFAYTSFAYKRYVFSPYKYHYGYYCKPLHRHVIYNQPKHVRAQVWDHHHRRDLDYWQAVHRNSNIGSRSEAPDRRVRGFAQSENRREARAVANDLQERHARTDFRTTADRRTAPDTRTSPLAGERVARARDIDTIRDRGARTAPPVERTIDRTERGAEARTRTPNVSGNGDRAVRVDRAPVPRDRAATRQPGNGIDRTGRTDSTREIRTLPADRGIDARDRSTLPTDRGDTRVDRGRDATTAPPDRGIDRTPPRTDRGTGTIDRGMDSRTPTDRGARTTDRGTLPTDRGIDRTAPGRESIRTREPIQRFEQDSYRMQSTPRSTSTDRSARSVDRSGATLDPSRGMDVQRSRPATRPETSIERPREPQMPSTTVLPDRGAPSRDFRSAPTTSAPRYERPSPPSRAPIESDVSRGMNYRSEPRSAPEPVRTAPAPSRAPTQPSMRGNAPTAPDRSISSSSPSSPGPARSAPARPTRR